MVGWIKLRRNKENAGHGGAVADAIVAAKIRDAGRSQHRSAAEKGDTGLSWAVVGCPPVALRAARRRSLLPKLSGIADPAFDIGCGSARRSACSGAPDTGGKDHSEVAEDPP